MEPTTNIPIRSRQRWLSGLALLLAVTLPAYAAKPGGGGGGGGGGKPNPPSCSIDSAVPSSAGTGCTDATAICVEAGGTIAFTGSATGGSTPYLYEWQFDGADPFQSSDNPATATYATAGAFTASFTVTDAKGQTCTQQQGVEVTGGTGTGMVSINSTSTNAATPPASPVTEQSITPGELYQVLAANDLGMHCADLDYQIFSILPPFNVLHAQVIRRGSTSGEPEIMDGTNIEVVYSAASSPLDPAVINPAGSSVFKSNFWRQEGTDNGVPVYLGYQVYSPLYFGLLKPGDVRPETGLPVPDSMLLRSCLDGYLAGTDSVDQARAKCGLGQQVMPGLSMPYVVNDPKPFDRFDQDINFFNELLGPIGLGGIISETKWFAADGVPMLPVDDSGRANAYPLMRVQARDKGTGTVLASLDVVLPVASEADCQSCHVEPTDCGWAAIPGLTCTGEAMGRTAFTPMSAMDAPGDTNEQQLLNAAKINILRTHDAKHGTTLDTTRKVVCASCHYSPALDLAQLGPMLEQTKHITMSRAMHGHHGDLMDKATGTTPLFPDMPAPPRDPAVTQQVLQETCYQCHPGKRTKCLRGAMASADIVCQDCHGNMLQVGNDFSANLTASAPFGSGSEDLTKRVPWASEPGCQSCHTGDAVNTNHPADAIVAPDGIRLLRAFLPTVYADGTPKAEVIKAPSSRFAENQTLYRVSKGHGGVMCEGCHGSTHAIWPVGNPNANDNVAATQLQGHDGKIQECDVCHARGPDGNLTMPLGLEGPHGMHPVNDNRWNHEHKNYTGSQFSACRTCHGTNLKGTVLSAASADRVLDTRDSKQPQKTFTEGHQFGCGDCHQQKR